MFILQPAPEHPSKGGSGFGHGEPKLPHRRDRPHKDRPQNP